MSTDANETSEQPFVHRFDGKPEKVIGALKCTLWRYHDYIRTHFKDWEFPTFVQEMVEEAIAIPGGESQLKEMVESFARMEKLDHKSQIR